jgi:putative redox protein
VHVTLTHHKEPGTPRPDKIDRVVRFEGALDDAQRTRLLEIANRCPVHQTLTTGVDVATSIM